MQYTKIKNMNDESNFPRIVDKITFHFADSMCWDDDADFVIGINGGIFKSANTPSESKEVRIFIEVPYRRWDFRGMSETEQNALLKNLMREIIEVSFSTEQIENPSYLADSLSGKSCSYLISKILRHSDFTDFDMRHPVTQDSENYTILLESKYELTISRKN